MHQVVMSSNLISSAGMRRQISALMERAMDSSNLTNIRLTGGNLEN